MISGDGGRSGWLGAGERGVLCVFEGGGASCPSHGFFSPMDGKLPRAAVPLRASSPLSTCVCVWGGGGGGGEGKYLAESLPTGSWGEESCPGAKINRCPSLSCPLLYLVPPGLVCPRGQDTVAAVSCPPLLLFRLFVCLCYFFYFVTSVLFFQQARQSLFCDCSMEDHNFSLCEVKSLHSSLKYTLKCC